MIQKSQRIRDKLWVHWKGRIYSVPADLTRVRTTPGGEESQDLLAPFSCKVLKLHVSPGQMVKKGDPVVVVEAMKMEYAYSSPKTGEVQAVLAKEGEILQGGSPFVTWKEKP